MIPNPEQLLAIAKMREGNLDEIPFPVLLHALAAQKRTAVIECERKPLKKEILIERGTPVDCRSNLLHETLGRSMISSGMLTQQQEQEALAKAATQGLQMGEVLILDGVITASELYKILQQNLAKKLLDMFTWRSGTFRVQTELPEVDSPLKVNAAQLVVTGISKFASDDEVNGAVGPLVGKKLFVHPDPPYPLNDIRLSKQQQQLVDLLESGKRIDELAAETTIPFDQIMRLAYSLAVIGVVVPEDRMPKDAKPKPKPMPKAKPAPAPPPAPVAAVAIGPSPAEIKRKRDELMEAYLRYRKLDAFELFDLGESASLEEIQDAYLAFSEKFAPWSFTAVDDLKSLTEKAEDLFIAGGMSFGELCDAERRNTLLLRRQNLRETREKAPDPSRFAIKSDLLDSEQQFQKGKALMDAGEYKDALQQLQFAYDCDPQNSIYRSELAYCKFLENPNAQASRAKSELRETIRIDPRCGLAAYYMGEILRIREEYDDAEKYLERANKLMGGDRRPIEALKTTQAEKKKKKKKGFAGLLGSD